MGASARASVCVLGSANMDLVAVVDRAPQRGETVTGRSFARLPGGKGANQALAASRAGAAVTIVAAVGDDPFAQEIRDVLAAAGVDTTGIQVAEVPTGTAHIVVDDAGENSIVVVPGANGTLRSLTDEHRRRIEAADSLLLQLELPLSIVAEAAAHAHAYGVTVVLTPAPVQPLPAALLTEVDLLVPNQHEAAQMTGHHDPGDAARALVDSGASAVVVTLGERGCLYLDRNSREPIVEPAPNVRAIDTTAAGDTFVGCLAVALGEGHSTAEALRWANAAAGLSVQRMGASASMPLRAEIEAALEDRRG